MVTESLVQQRSAQATCSSLRSTDAILVLAVVTSTMKAILHQSIHLTYL